MGLDWGFAAATEIEFIACEGRDIVLGCGTRVIVSGHYVCGPSCEKIIRLISLRKDSDLVRATECTVGK